MPAPPLSVYLVLSLGALCGGVVKGLTGFGNAIINLLVWVTFTAAGVNGGLLQTAVLADSLGCVVCAIPLLIMTSAHKTADWRLVVTIFLFTTAGAPLGAALLTGLDPRWVELAMACVLLLVICLHVKLHEKLAAAIRKAQGKSRPAPYGPLDERGAVTGPAKERRLPGAKHAAAGDADASLHCIAVDTLPSPLESRRPSLPGEATLPLIPEDPSSPTKHRLSDDCDDGRDYAAVAEDDCGNATKPEAGSTNLHGMGPTAAALVTAYCSRSLSGCAADADPAVSVAAHDCEAGGPGEHGEEHACCGRVATDTQPLLGSGTVASDDAAAARAAASCDSPDKEGLITIVLASPSPAATSSHAVAGGGRGGVRARLRCWVARQDWPGVRRILAIGSIAGFVGGIMNGMTGIGGPPIMYMYEKLQVDKEVVRGTNAVTNVLQVKILFYIALGVFKRSDALLYAVTSVAGLLGVGLGNLLAGRIDQKGFSRIMVALMVICCGLLFLSAAGLKGHGA